MPPKGKEDVPMFNESEELSLLSKVQKISNVSEFKWSYKDTAGKTQDITEIQCILINPKWADHGKKVFTGSNQQE